jgi:hypothetical protein
MLAGFFEDFSRKPLANIGRYWGARFGICGFAKELEGHFEL